MTTPAIAPSAERAKLSLNMVAIRLIFTSIVLTGSILFSLIIGEVMLRLLGYAGAPESLIGNIQQVDDPILDWRFVPNSTVQYGNVVSHYNNAGFRDVEHTVEKPAHVKRVVIIGDSVTEGNGVKQEELFATHVQAFLGNGYEVINLGMSGLNTPQEVHLLDVEGMKYHPDIVVLNFILNDCGFFSNIQGTERFEKDKDSKIGLFGDIAINPKLKRAIKLSALIYFVKERVEYIVGVIRGKDERNYYSALWENPECRKRILTSFDSLQKLQQEHGFAVQVVLWPLLVNYEHYEFSSVHQWVTKAAEEKGFKVLDLFPVYSSQWYRNLQVTAEDNVHPNGEGHRLSAQAYADWSRQSSNLSTQ